MIDIEFNLTTLHYLYKTYGSCERVSPPLGSYIPKNMATAGYNKLCIISYCKCVNVCRIPGQYFTGDSSWGVEPVNVYSTNQQMYSGSELIYSHGPTVLPQDVALYNDYVKEIMI